MFKSQEEILSKLKIESLNKMQERAIEAIKANDDVILISPTGTGKTLAFLLPLCEAMNRDIDKVQSLIITPSRELAIQIEQVARDMGTGHKINVVYGGRPFSKDKLELQSPPALLIGTPGRVADHLRKSTFSVDYINTIILDEYDKSLEIGFEDEMSEIMEHLTKVKKKILTSATKQVRVPSFVELDKPVSVDFSDTEIDQLVVKRVVSEDKDKLACLYELLCHLGDQSGIIFCNFKDSISRISDFLDEEGISHGVFYGGLDQVERERALIKFRNGSHQVLLATDLAARGIDVPSLDYIIHYHLPLRPEEFVHRNGRTARMNASGTAYVLHWSGDRLPDFIRISSDRLVINQADLKDAPTPQAATWTTLYISGGRKDNISKGDIAGHIYKQGVLEKGQLGVIELKGDCAFVGVPRSDVKRLVTVLDNTRIKKRKVRIYEV